MRIAGAIAVVEKAELPMLSWGISDSSMTEDEVLDLLGAHQPSDDLEDLFDDLLESGLLVAGRDGYRSRMAETVRLAVRLRQWFPRQNWADARPLVSDFRFVRQVRSVPERHHSAADLVEKLQPGLCGTNWPTAAESLLSKRPISGFQLRSTQAILNGLALDGQQASGICVTAGTGAGKTLAFYLPALLHLTSVKTTTKSARVIGLYPRTELLRDQLRSILIELRRLPDASQSQLQVGVLYGATPRNKFDVESGQYRKWKSREGGLVCPFLTCLDEACGGDYLLPDTSQERLVCARCADEVTCLTLYRDSLTTKAPEILFTTTEMVNQSLGDSKWHSVLVGDNRGGPDLILLDEIHTYSGTHGAQVAGLLRRWRNDIDRSIPIVGLSATLADPEGFFSTLTGLHSGAVSVVAPEGSELVETGHSYCMLLRGDPASQTSLLSTTIQVAMLQRRMLDRSMGDPSGHIFGSRVFVFTDQLDVVNRLYDQLCDAEGWFPGSVRQNRRGPLAELRASNRPESDQRDRAGQLWEWSEGHNSLGSARVGRTSSQDAGVDDLSEIVVATASLEVGFDDPSVGAVVQHKAPRDAASFLQRRGRAGRDPFMRSWSTVVLSDFGHDRLAFQGYEDLVDPVVRAVDLPIDNRVILKMQATWLLVDDLRYAARGRSVRRLMERPWTDRPLQKELAQKVALKLRTYLTSEGANRLARRMAYSLGVTQREVDALLWDYPRAIVTALIPTLLRRMEAIGADEMPPEPWADLLAEFVPSTLFNPLQTREVELTLPGAFDEDAERVENVPITLALTQYAPGRVDYRFATKGQRHRMWLEPPVDGSALEVDTFMHDSVDLQPPPGYTGRVLQPTAMNLGKPPQDTDDSASGRWIWRFAAQPGGTSLPLDVPRSSWTGMIGSAEAFLHRHRSPVTVWRYSDRCMVEPTAETSYSAAIVKDGAPVAIGASYEADALRLRITLPPSADEYELDAATIRALRPTYFGHLIDEHDYLKQSVPSPFLRKWLSETAISSLLLLDCRTFRDALASVSDEEWATRMVDTASAVFASESPGAGDPGEADADQTRLVQQIQATVHVPRVMTALRECAEQSLNGELEGELLVWLHQRTATTLAAAVLEAMQTLCPALDVGTITPDISQTGNEAIIWFTENEPGGTGTLGEVVEQYLEDPRRFWGLTASSLRAGDREVVQTAMAALLREAVTPGSDVQNRLSEIRTASNLADRQSGWSSLRSVLFERGIDASPSLLSLISTRLLRPQSNSSYDSFVHDLLAEWTLLEETYETEIGLRTFATHSARDPRIQQALRSLSGGELSNESSMISQITGLLWNRGAELRTSVLQAFNRYERFPPTERLLLSGRVERSRHVVDSSAPDWRSDLDAALDELGECDLACVSGAAASEIVIDLSTTASSADVLEVYPRVAGVSRDLDGITLTVEIREALQ